MENRVHGELVREDNVEAVMALWPDEYGKEVLAELVVSEGANIRMELRHSLIYSRGEYLPVRYRQLVFEDGKLQLMECLKGDLSSVKKAFGALNYYYE